MATGEREGVIRRWWALPLVVAALVDAALVARFETSPGLAVDHAILRTVSGDGCEQAVLVRGVGSDQLFVIDTWVEGGGWVGDTATASFVPGLGLTPASEAAILADSELDLSQLGRPVHLALRRDYQAQIGAAASWLRGPCLPFANPFQSHLRRLGTVRAGAERYTVYRGRLRYVRGAFQLFGLADVWMGVRADGRMGFEVVRELGGGSSTPSVTVATLFQYPKAHLGRRFAREAPALRARFYREEYQAVLSTLSSLTRWEPGAAL
jgi:hypothetical protein